jgi:TonB family protein
MEELLVQGSADKVAALVDEIRASKSTKGKAIVTGSSQGGLIAYVVAARQPERVDAVVPLNASLPRFAWPDEERIYGNRPILRALNGADDELSTAIEVQRCIVKLRMLKLDATVRLYEKTGHEITPAMKADLFRMLSWLVAGTAEPSPCEPCSENSMDPDSCSLCPRGPMDTETKFAMKANRPGQAAPQAADSAPDAPRSGPDAILGRKGITSTFSTKSGGSNGFLSQEEIQGTLRRNMASIRYCYDQQVARQPTLEGRVTVRFVIAPDGGVSSAEIASSTLGDVGVETCVKRAVTRIRFPQPQGGSVIITYPFTFASVGH